MKEIDVNAFRGLSNLGWLDLSYNWILTEISANLLHHLINLEELRLKNNRISSVKEGAFKGLKKLKKLELGRNVIEWLS